MSRTVSGASFFGATNIDEMLLRYREPVLKFKDGICFQLLELLKDYLTLEKKCLSNRSTPDEAKPSVGKTCLGEKLEFQC
jgi:hypothetical protein